MLYVQNGMCNLHFVVLGRFIINAVRELTRNFHCHLRFPQDVFRSQDVECNRDTKVGGNEDLGVPDIASGRASVLIELPLYLDPKHMREKHRFRRCTMDKKDHFSISFSFISLK